MTIQPVANNTAATQAQQTQQAQPEQTQETAQTAKAATAAKAKADSVTISKQAMLMNSPGYSASEEATESPAAKAAEKTKGQR
ncbi:hypothetical protein FY034_15135 [Trichlorobacter lovleyi]|uniref:hypothetical protein n=1 Tax=Trichlorobacter lovleyi TaxID=313985 RepID=UPI00223F7BFE|nr:hypothetical protein [Trichlorobacter lovleyi]QOX80211.1 hypothetical protein FY034_15135 [Trichlorobacter lovleyi]